MEAHASEATDTERQQRPFVLQPAELALDGTALAVQVAPPRRAAGNQRVQAVGFDPRRARLALAGGATPLRRTPLHVRASERPRPVLARRRTMLTRENLPGLAKRDDGPDAASLALAVDRVGVIALVQHRVRRHEPTRDQRVKQHR